MKKQKDYTLHTVLLALVISVLSSMCFDNTPKMHTCEYSKCPFIGQTKFVGHLDCVEGSDCYYLDKIHFDHPSLTYDECENMLFGQDIR